jgi:hypothetical protein
MCGVLHYLLCCCLEVQATELSPQASRMMGLRRKIWPCWLAQAHITTQL